MRLMLDSQISNKQYQELAQTFTRFIIMKECFISFPYDCYIYKIKIKRMDTQTRLSLRLRSPYASIQHVDSLTP